MLRTAELVTLIIADISGCTRCLGGTEHEHAENVLSDLPDTVGLQLGPRQSQGKHPRAHRSRQLPCGAGGAGLTLSSSAP